MQRKEFENRIKSLLLKAADDVVESWAEYATELDQDGTEAALVCTYERIPACSRFW